MRRAFFGWERSLRGPTPVVFYDEAPKTSGKLIAIKEVEGGTSNAEFFYHDETPAFAALEMRHLPKPDRRESDQ